MKKYKIIFQQKMLSERKIITHIVTNPAQNSSCSHHSNISHVVVKGRKSIETYYCHCAKGNSTRAIGHERKNFSRK